MIKGSVPRDQRLHVRVPSDQFDARILLMGVTLASIGCLTCPSFASNTGDVRAVFSSPFADVASIPHAAVSLKLISTDGLGALIGDGTRFCRSFIRQGQDSHNEGGKHYQYAHWILLLLAERPCSRGALARPRHQLKAATVRNGDVVSVLEIGLPFRFVPAEPREALWPRWYRR